MRPGAALGRGGRGVAARAGSSAAAAARRISPPMRPPDPPQEEENLHVKTIGNMAHMTRMIMPHHGLHAPGRHAVGPAGALVDGARSNASAPPDWGRLVLHHYVTKSWQDYEAKMARGSAMSNHKNLPFWEVRSGR